jgi:ABC-type transport system substrate-binding protein
MRGVPEVATRVAMIQNGEADVVNQMTGEVLAAVQHDSKLRVNPLKGAPGWLEMAPDRPDSPLKDVRVRQAVSLAIDKAISDAEHGGMASLEGNWIPEDWPGALRRPSYPFDLDKAKQLMAEAGVAGGFDVGTFTPLPPYTSWAERIVSQLRAISVRTQVNTMERAAFYEKLTPGPNRLTGFIMPLSGAPGDAASRIRENAVCAGSFSGICEPEIEERMKKYDASTDPQERQKLLDEVQAYLIDNYLLTLTVRQAFINVLGPRIANPAENVMGSIPQYNYIGPYEDIELKE